MFRKIAAAVKNAAVGWVHSIGDAFKRRLQPARIGTRPLAAAARDAVRPRSELVAENALLRHQLVVLRRGVRRPRLHDGDRLTMVLLASLNDAWPDALHLVKPETLLRWHRDLFRWFWRRKSRRRGRQPRLLTRDTAELITSMPRARESRSSGSRPGRPTSLRSARGFSAVCDASASTTSSS